MGKSSKKSSHKHKKHRHHSSSSSSSESEAQWQEAPENNNNNDASGGAVVKGPTMPTQADLEKQEKEKPAPVTFALEPFDFDAIGTYQKEDKQAIKKQQSLAEMEAVMKERELNPSLRSQPMARADHSKKAKVGDAGLDWHRRAYERCKQQATEQNRPLSELVSERYGSMEKLMSLINDAEDLEKDDHSSSHRRKFLHPNERHDRHNRHHHHHHHHHHHEKKSWKRQSDAEEQSTPPPPSKKQARTDEIEKEEEEEEGETAEPVVEESKDDELVSEENLLELRKQLIRAELAGDDEMIDLLRNEIKNIDRLRGNPQHEEQQPGRGTEPKVLVMTTIDRYGVEKPVHNAYDHGAQRQHGHVDKRDRRKMKKEMRKMRNNDKDPERQGLSLQDLVEMERHSTTNMTPVLPSNRHNSMMTADRQILSSTRHLSGWSRIQALADQKKRQQTFEQCWLCIENLSKSYIFGLLDQWFLCAPPQQSLVDGHCFIVPVQHTSSRFHIDDDVLSELDDLKEKLTNVFRKAYNQVPIFIETFKNPRLLPHLYIECIPVPIEQANLVPMYFRKALLESESMWATNKKLIPIPSARSRTLKSLLPKGLPYFVVEFPGDRNDNESVYGYAHMIEERGQFPLYFGREILGGLMQLDNPLLWMRPASKEPEETVEKKCTYLKQLWKRTTVK